MEVDNQVVNELPVVEESAGVKTIGEQFTDTEAYAKYMSNGVKGVDLKQNLNNFKYHRLSTRVIKSTWNIRDSFKRP